MVLGWIYLPSFGSVYGPLGCGLPVGGPGGQRGGDDQGEVPIIHDMWGQFL